jgi:hypothetical protein
MPLQQTAAAVRLSRVFRFSAVIAAELCGSAA